MLLPKSSCFIIGRSLHVHNYFKKWKVQPLEYQNIDTGTTYASLSHFSFSDVDILDKLADSWPVKCTYIVKEMILTERAYVQALTDVIKVHIG